MYLLLYFYHNLNIIFITMLKYESHRINKAHIHKSQHPFLFALCLNIFSYFHCTACSLKKRKSPANKNSSIHTHTAAV